jgi:putative ABC transport system permease protein
MPASRWRRLLLMARTGVVMTTHDGARFFGTVAGVVFAVVLAVQQLGILFALLDKNTMFVDHAGADVFVAPPSTNLFQPGSPLPRATLDAVRATPGVALVSPLVVGGGTVRLPSGGAEGLTLIGVDTTTWLGGPWNIVAGAREALAAPDVILLEDSIREKAGNINLHSVREVNGRQVRIGGFVWGLQPFGPPYTFADIDLARELTGGDPGRVDYVLVTVQPNETPETVAARLQTALPDATVWTRAAFHDRIVTTLLAEQLGVSFGTSTAFGLVIGLVVVSLSMFSAVIDNLREFGTLKAIGATNLDLTVLVLSQSALFAAVGSAVGLVLAVGLSAGIRSPQLAVILPPWLILLVPPAMLAMCLAASVLALARIWRLEPGMVFR